MPPLSSEKYLLLRINQHPSRCSTILWGGVGLLHFKKLFLSFLSLSASLGRTAVLEDIACTEQHNYNMPFARNPKLYFDLDDALCCKQSSPKKRLNIKYVLSKDFDMDQFAPKDIGIFDFNRDRTHIPHAMRQKGGGRNMHNRYPLIILQASTEIHRSWYKSMIKQVPAGEQCKMAKNIQWAPYIRKIATEIVTQMTHGKGRETLQAPARDYWVIHARHTDAWRSLEHTHMGLMRWHCLSSASNIKKNLARIQGINQNTVIYFMSNDTQPGYLDALKADYPYLYTYNDFASLKVLRRNDREHLPDNYLLFAIERAMLENAKGVVGLKRLGGTLTLPSPTLVPLKMLSWESWFKVGLHYLRRYWYSFRRCISGRIEA